MKMHVTKRNGQREEVSFDKVLKRLRILSHGLDIDITEIASKVCSRIFDGVHTTELDELAANICSSLVFENPDFGTLAARISISNHHKNTKASFVETMDDLYSYTDTLGNHRPIVSSSLHAITYKYKNLLDSEINHQRDFEYDYFGFRTLQRSYLMKIDGHVVERPQHMLMRVAIGIHGDDIERALETYHLLSKRFFTHATPTLFNAGTQYQQMSSCYLVSIIEDSLEGIFDTIKECSKISKWSGGIGIHISDVRARGSRINKTNGVSSGIIPMLRVFNNTARYVNQGSKRLGSIAVYLEPWHADVESFLELRKNHGNEEERCRDLFTALWVPDLFMERVRDNMNWSLMCPSTCPGLADVWGEQFKELYERYEAEGLAVRTVKAQELWFKVLQAQIEQGTPYLLYKDHANAKSNQKNIGTIKSSNLCAEIIEVSSPEETAVCNLASLCLPMYVNADKKEFDFQSLHKVTKIVTRNLNKVIDCNFYPSEKARVSNFRHRPIGIGVQGLADVFIMIRLPFDSEGARKLNKEIFETIYHAAIEASCELAKDDGWYESFPGSPASHGLLQFDLWGKTDEPRMWKDWDALKERVKTHGLRNSLLVAIMPTASTSNICGFNECVEAFTTNIFKRSTLSGEFIIVNKYLVKDLMSLGLWDAEMRRDLILNEGSVQDISRIPDDIKALYKTMWELKQKTILDLAIDRGQYVCQSQSQNVFLSEPNFQMLTSLHFYAWSGGLKTSSYYLRSHPAAKTQKFTIQPSGSNKSSKTVPECSTDGTCLMCSS